MARKLYWVCKSRYGALGASGALTRLAGRFTRKERADKECARLNRTEADYPRTCYFVEWDWA